MSRENLNLVSWQAGRFVLVRPGGADNTVFYLPDVLPENTVFALPANQVRTLSVPVAPEEVRHLRQALPFMLEDSLLDDVEEVHVASRPLEHDQHAVALVRVSAMEDWFEAATESVCEIPWVSEALCLPWSVGECTLIFEPDSVLLRWSESEGTRIERSLLGPLLDGLSLSSHSLIAYSSNQGGDAALIPENLRSCTQWRTGGLSEALLLSEVSASRVDLRQGRFAPRLPLMRWWGLWRQVAVALGVALILKTGLAVADYQTLTRENLQLRQAIQDSYRRVNPRGTVVDVEKQLNRQLAEFGAGSSKSSFTPILVDTVDALARVGGVTVTSFNYSGTGAIRLNLSAPDFKSVEQVREQLRNTNLPAELESSSARGEGVVARLSIEATP